MRRALLLREASAAYEVALAEIGFVTHFSPVLEYEFADQRELEKVIERHPAAVLVVTSPRGAAAVARLALLGRSPRRAFALGEETSSLLRDAGIEVKGEGAKDAAVLARVIIAEHDGSELVFVCGDRRRDVLPDALRAASVAFQQVVAYRTILREGPFAAPAPSYDWVAIFSPSGVEAATPDPSFPWGARLAAIGDTTAEAIREAGWRAEAVARSPTPHGLARALADSQ